MKARSGRRLLRWGCLSGLALLFLLTAAFFLLRQPDLDPAALEARYARGASRFLTLPTGARVHYRDQGVRGVEPMEPLILLHGSASSLHTWEPWVERLEDSFRLITLDLPGHGLTGPVPSEDYSISGMAAFLDEFVSTLGLERFHLGGNSLGGAVAWNYALAHPEKVDRLILVDAAGYRYDETRKPPLVFRLARMPVVGELLGQLTPRSLIEGNLHQVFHDDSQVTDAMVTRYHDLVRRQGNRRTTLQRLRAGRGDIDPGRIPEIKAPTLILWGEEDTWAPVAWARRFHEDLPHSELVIYPGVGHITMEETPDASAAAVREFLREPTEADATPTAADP